MNYEEITQELLKGRNIQDLELSEVCFIHEMAMNPEEYTKRKEFRNKLDNIDNLDDALDLLNW